MLLIKCWYWLINVNVCCSSTFTILCLGSFCLGNFISMDLLKVNCSLNLAYDYSTGLTWWLWSQQQPRYQFQFKKTFIWIANWGVRTSKCTLFGKWDDESAVYCYKALVGVFHGLSIGNSKRASRFSLSKYLVSSIEWRSSCTFESILTSAILESC